MRYLIKNIGKLIGAAHDTPLAYAGAAIRDLPVLDNAWLVINNGKVENFGQGIAPDIENQVSMLGRWVWPSWCDSHSHLVYAEPRQNEWQMRLQGSSYAEIAAAGGGILQSAAKLAALDEETLYERTRVRALELIRMGTGAIEIKSGYGLTLEAEMKMLRVARRIGEELPLDVKTTFLGAHAVPAGQDRASYFETVVRDWLPQVAEAGLADYVDIFCEENYFTIPEMVRLIEVGHQYGLQAKVHVNQFTSTGAVASAVGAGALSVDHLEVMTESDFDALKKGQTMPVLLPGCSLFLGIPYGSGRRLIDEGNALVLASDYNPGSCPSGNMQLVAALACSQMGLLPEEAIIAATQNGAAAMGLSNTCGNLAVGKWANFWVSEPMVSPASLLYYFGHSAVQEVWWHGTKV
jgi:imidazolonepropionase